MATPNMNLPAPVPGTTPGPDWATDITACFDQIDSHDHSPGKGVPITPDGMDISSDLSMGGNNLTNANSVGFSTLLAALTSLTRTLQVVSKDLYFIDGDGNSVRITQSGTVTGATGTITGLPSGTASASFSGGTFTFESATNTPAQMAVGPLIVGRVAAGSATVTITPNSGQSVSYTLTLPSAQGAANTIMVNNGSGTLQNQTIATILSTAGILSTVSGTQSGTSATLAWKELVPISLSAGTYLISGAVQYRGSNNTLVSGNINTTTASQSGTTYGLNRFDAPLDITNSVGTVAIPPFSVVLGGSTAYYLNASLNETNTGTFYGSILAVRIA